MSKEPEAPPLDWACASRPANGETISGDLHLVRPFADGVLLAVVDGLGHGDDAAAAAREAITFLGRHASESPLALAEQCHRALTQTRGVVATLAFIDTREGTLTWLGVGNVEGRLFRADPQASPPAESLLLRGGLLGYQLPALQADLARMKPGDLLVLATDGIAPDFTADARAGEPLQAVADRILERSGKGFDDALVLVVRYPGPQQ